MSSIKISLSFLIQNYWNIFIKSSIFFVPILKLQVLQIGLRFDNIVFPPIHSGIIWPQWKDIWIISELLQHKHLYFPISSPIHLFHTWIFKAIGIAFFLYLINWDSRIDGLGGSRIDGLGGSGIGSGLGSGLGFIIGEEKVINILSNKFFISINKSSS